LADVDIQNPDLCEHYPELGSNPMLDDRPNAVYIPHDREGNKSKRPRVLPLDDGTRRVLLRYLLVRPDAAHPWVFLSKSNHVQIDDKDVNTVWKEHFRPEYDETEQHRGITSHFGRHRFTTWFRVEKDAPRELVKYMRGDRAGEQSTGDRAGIDSYLHTYYEDIEPLYRQRIYDLGV
jgi:integrase